MKGSHYLMLMVLMLMAFIGGYMTGKDGRTGLPEDMTETAVTTVDTLKSVAPKAQDEKQLGTARYTLTRPAGRVTGVKADRGAELTGEPAKPRAGEKVEQPSALEAELPMIQRHYTDSNYEAWVSGPVDPRLDSVRVYAKRTVVNRREWKPPKRWHVGITAGYGYGAKGFQPYIGVGVTYSLYSF